MVKKRLFEHEKICREAKRYRWKCLFQCKIITRGDCKKFFLTTNNNEPDPNELKKHLNENHEIPNAVSCKFILKNPNCNYWFKYYLDDDGEEEIDVNDINQPYKGPPHFIN